MTKLFLNKPALSAIAAALLAFPVSAGPDPSGTDRAASLLASHPADCPDELYLEFTRSGARTYHGCASRRVKNLEALVSLERDEGKGRFVAKIEEYLKAYARMRSWVFPAHDSGLAVFEGKELYADLGAVRICLAVAESLSVCGDRLDSAVADRMRSEMRRRVFDPCLKSAAEVKAGGRPSCRGHWWFLTRNNWNAVCFSCVVRAALLVFPEGSEERAKLVEAAVDAVPRYMKGFTDDGYCSEGAGYWNYGFGHFLLMARALASAPEKIDLFAKFPKSKTVARYGFEYRLTDKVSPLFADGGGIPDARLVEMCCETWPDLSDAAGEECSSFPDAQVWIFRPGGGHSGISIGLKGGHNGEFHNHNDVGSYDIALGDVILTGDVGGETYTRRTFSPQRYESKVLNSYAHPVPRVGGALQGTGGDFRARVLKCARERERDIVELDIRGAYADTNLLSLVRTFTYSRAAGTVSVKDSYRFASPSEFVSPLVTGGAFGADGSVLRDGASLAVSANVEGGSGEWFEETVENPGRSDVHIRGLRVANATEGSVEYVFRGEKAQPGR